LLLTRTSAVRLTLLGAVMLTAFLFPSAAHGHPDRQFGQYHLNYPCCNSENLYGTRASIRPNSMSMGAGNANCLAIRSDAESTNRLIQTGVNKCFNGASNGSCSATGLLERYVEIWNGSTFTCYPKGTTSFGTDARFTVQRTQPSTWYAFIAGVQDTHALTGMDNAVVLIEGGEYTDSCSGTWSASATYGLSTVFSRFTGSIWFNVQSSYAHRECGWSVNGGPTGSWTMSR
jgi:hypothetical protein